MFANAYRQAGMFTRPVVISVRKNDGTCGAGIGTFVVVNDEGWILTAAHIIEQIGRLAEARQRFLAYEAEVKAIQDNAGILSDQKKKKIKKLDLGPTAVTHFSSWWSFVGADIRDVKVLLSADLAVARLEPFNPTSIPGYPVFKDSSKPIAPGTSLCRLGFPFYEIVPTFANDSFQLPAGTMPFFPNEGILTREIVTDQAGEVFGGFIETSSPGLRGQSGGPIFDQHATVWGIQSQTMHHPLGFSPPVPGGKPGEKEHQFLNAGMGSHPASIHGLLDKLGVKHAISAY